MSASQSIEFHILDCTRACGISVVRSDPEKDRASIEMTPDTVMNGLKWEVLHFLNYEPITLFLTTHMI